MRRRKHPCQLLHLTQMRGALTPDTRSSSSLSSGAGSPAYSRLPQAQKIAFDIVRQGHCHVCAQKSMCVRMTSAVPFQSGPAFMDAKQMDLIRQHSALLLIDDSSTLRSLCYVNQPFTSICWLRSSTSSSQEGAAQEPADPRFTATIKKPLGMVRVLECC